MPPHNQVPEPWFSFLNELDRLATTTVRLDCIGGFVVTMLYGLERPTADVDVIGIAPLSAAFVFDKVAMQGGELHRKYGTRIPFWGESRHYPWEIAILQGCAHCKSAARNE